MTAWHLRLAARILRAGGVIAYPTEAVFGLGCVPSSCSAVARILSIKRRHPEKGLIIAAADIGQVRAWVDFSRVDVKPVLASWPGPVTWVLPAARGTPPWIMGPQGTLAIRVSAHPVVRGLCAAVGPIISTSANPSGRPPARSPLRVRAYFRRELDFVVPGRPGPARGPTEVRNALTGAVLRSGG